MHRERRSQKGDKVIIKVAVQAADDASVDVSSFHAIGVHRTVVVIAKIAIVNCSVVCVHCALQGWFLVISRVLQALSPCVPCRFVPEGVDGTRYLAVSPRLLVPAFLG
jgi:hypothetical protein